MLEAILTGPSDNLRKRGLRGAESLSECDQEV
jgi:hypothetical protein